MTEIVVAHRDGILTAPSGEKFRLVRGKTLADARHPGVRMRPESWGPVVIELSVDDPEPSDSSDTDARVSELLASVEQAEAERDGYRVQLAAVADVLGQRGLMPLDAGSVEGWLARAVAEAIDRSAAALPTAPAPTEVAPPRGARARRPKPAAVAPAAEMTHDIEDEDDDDLS